jgi:hypothetical protein
MMSILFFTACCVVCAQAGAREPDSVDADVTIVGRDETTIPIPPPPHAWPVDLPGLDTRPFAPQKVPAIQPPAGEWAVPWPTMAIITVYYQQEPPS